MKSVILTGADGFIGRQAILPMLDRGFEVHAVSNIEPTADLLFENVTWHKVNLLDANEVKELTEKLKATHLLHFAWYVEHGKFWNSEQNKVWVDASLELLKNFQANGGKRVVVSGTCVEYDLDKDEFLKENSTPLKPHTLYGKSKLELQQRLAELNLNWAWGRIFFLFGENEHPNRLVSSVINSLLKDEFADCSHGEQIRDFLDVKDVADAFVALLDSDINGAVNIASGKTRTIKSIVQKIADIIGNSEKVRFGVVPVSENEPKRIVADVTRLQDEVKWKPSKDIAERLRENIDWWHLKIGRQGDKEKGR
jgi:nucleoside-diphosphate-sugar epimerase